MSDWCGVLGREEQVARFERIDASGRWASAYLFAGPAGIGKHAFATALAKTLLCVARGDRFAACGQCAACREFDAGAHSDFAEVSKPPDRAGIPIDLLVGPPERRMQEGLCHWTGLRPVHGERKVAVIDDADFLAEEGANALLKTLEEPPPGCVLILVAASAERLLPTIRSRCQSIRFAPLATDVVAELCLRLALVEDEAGAAELARRSGGSLRTAATLAGADVGVQIDAFVRELATPEFDPFALAKQATAFAEAAGKEAAKRRDRLRLLLHAVAELLRGAVRAASGATTAQSGAEQLASSARGDVDCLLDALERTTDALQHIDRNANQATALECWLDDVARALRGEVLA